MPMDCVVPVCSMYESICEIHSAVVDLKEGRNRRLPPPNFWSTVGPGPGRSRPWCERARNIFHPTPPPPQIKILDPPLCSLNTILSAHYCETAQTPSPILTIKNRIRNKCTRKTYVFTIIVMYVSTCGLIIQNQFTYHIEYYFTAPIVFWNL